MATVEIFTKSWCGYSTAAKEFLDTKGVPYREIDVTTDSETEQLIIEWSGRHTVPQVFIDGRSVGGFDDLVALEATGELDRLLGASDRIAA